MQAAHEHQERQNPQSEIVLFQRPLGLDQSLMMQFGRCERRRVDRAQKYCSSIWIPHLEGVGVDQSDTGIISNEYVAVVQVADNISGLVWHLNCTGQADKGLEQEPVIEPRAGHQPGMGRVDVNDGRHALDPRHQETGNLAFPARGPEQILWPRDLRIWRAR